MIVFGLILCMLPLYNSFKEGWFVLLIYGIPMLIIGFFILFNSKEDDIEKIKNKNLKNLNSSKSNKKLNLNKGGKK